MGRFPSIELRDSFVRIECNIETVFTNQSFYMVDLLDVFIIERYTISR